MKTPAAFAFLSLTLLCTSAAHAEPFGSGANLFDIEFVTIGNPGNAADDISANPHFAGSVAQEYRIGKFEISEDMINKANALGGLGLTHSNRGPNKPATAITWFEAARFVNWLNTSTGSTPAYKFDGAGNFQLWQSGDLGFNAANLYRNSLATYFLPSVDEWYKAAYYDPTSGIYFDFPTGSNTAPTAVAIGTAPGTAVYKQSFGIGPADITLAGGLSPYGTMGQGGNVAEWEETDFDLVNNSISSNRGNRGGIWFFNRINFALSASNRSGIGPNGAGSSSGFRVASIPEPSSLLLGVLGAVGLLLWRKVGR